tara:strand:- start:191 stop:691 length:501 start_codon:yes stop_codon:yes gene_type:complete
VFNLNKGDEMTQYKVNNKKPLFSSKGCSVWLCPVNENKDMDYNPNWKNGDIVISVAIPKDKTKSNYMYFKILSKAENGGSTKLSGMTKKLVAIVDTFGSIKSLSGLTSCLAFCKELEESKEAVSSILSLDLAKPKAGEAVLTPETVIDYLRNNPEILGSLTKKKAG